jgi:hypothetical protein
MILWDFGSETNVFGSASCEHYIGGNKQKGLHLLFFKLFNQCLVLTSKMLAQRYKKKMLKCNKNNYKSTKRL